MEHRDPYFCRNLGRVRPVVRGCDCADFVVAVWQGSCHGGDPRRRELEEARFFNKSLSDSKYVTNKATYISWAKFFEEGKGRNSKYQVEVLLAYWLFYYVFPSSLEDGLHNYFFLLVVLLVKAKRLALGTLYLSSLYARLGECSSNISCSIDLYDVVTHPVASVLHMFLWERFRLCPPSQ